MEIIKDTNGKRLRLTRSTLTELEPAIDAMACWRMELKDLADGTGSRIIVVKAPRECGAREGDSGLSYSSDFARRKVGCHYFGPRAFAKILAAARKETK
jgi:hypothetical protein